MMSGPPSRTNTLDELDPSAWGEPEFNSHLVTTCHRLRRGARRMVAGTEEAMNIEIKRCFT